jgi:methylmalonyl-CoA/ethylmalonyl-CoA epimerase
MRKVDHIGIVVRSLEASIGIYQRLGISVERVVPFRLDDGSDIRVAFLPVGEGIDLELIEAPQMLDEGAEPLNHIALAVADIETELERLKETNTPLEDERPRRGVSSPRIAFLNAEAADGVRIELTEKPWHE